VTCLSALLIRFDYKFLTASLFYASHNDEFLRRLLCADLYGFINHHRIVEREEFTSGFSREKHTASHTLFFYYELFAIIYSGKTEIYFRIRITEIIEAKLQILFLFCIFHFEII